MVKSEKRGEYPASAAHGLSEWPHHCAFVEPRVTGPSFSRKCSWFLVALERLRHSGQALLCSHIRFHPWFHQLAAFARTKMPAQFYAIHLRLETEYTRSFTGKLFILNGTAMDQCLVAKGWRPGADSVVYISSEQSIYRYPEVQHWLANERV